MKKLPWMKKPRIGKTAAGNKPRILFKILPAWTWKRKNWNWNDPMGLVNPSQDGARRGTAWNWNGMALSSVHWLVDSLSIERNKDYKCNSRDAPTSCVTFSSINVGLPMHRPRILFKFLPAWTWKRKNWNWNDRMGLINPSQDGARRGTAWNWNGMALSSVHWLVDSLSIERNKDYKCNSRDAPTSCVTFSSINVGLPMHAIHQLPGATLWLVNNVNTITSDATCAASTHH